MGVLIHKLTKFGEIMAYCVPSTDMLYCERKVMRSLVFNLKGEYNFMANFFRKTSTTTDRNGNVITESKISYGKIGALAAAVLIIAICCCA